MAYGGHPDMQGQAHADWAADRNRFFVLLLRRTLVRKPAATAAWLQTRTDTAPRVTQPGSRAGRGIGILFTDRDEPAVLASRAFRCPPRVEYAAPIRHATHRPQRSSVVRAHTLQHPHRRLASRQSKKASRCEALIVVPGEGSVTSRDPDRACRPGLSIPSREARRRLASRHKDTGPRAARP
jgi:hypothetical protein